MFAKTQGESPSKSTELRLLPRQFRLALADGERVCDLHGSNIARKKSINLSFMSKQKKPFKWASVISHTRT